MIPVQASAAPYRAALGTLPAGVRPAGGSDGALVVVSGDGWCARALRAFDEGARGVVIADPAEVAPEEARALGTRAAGRPVIVERPRLRADVAADARELASGAPPRPSAIVVDAASAPEGLTAVLRDAIGWARVLAGAPVRVREATESRHGAIAGLDAGGVPVSLVATSGSPDRGLVRVTVLAATRIEVEVDPGAGVARVTRDGADGSRTLPRRFEASARLFLRRAIAALEHPGAGAAQDLEDLIADAVIAEQVLTAGHHPH